MRRGDGMGCNRVQRLTKFPGSAEYETGQSQFEVLQSLI